MNLIQGDETIAGHIPELYETYLVPLISKPYAADLVQRVAATPIRSVLEGDAGTDMSFFRNFLATWREPHCLVVRISNNSGRSLPKRNTVRVFALAIAAFLYLSAGIRTACADTVIEWNAIAAALPIPEALNLTRVMATMHGAMHDALNAIEPRYDYASGSSCVSLNTSETCYAWLMCSYDSIEATLEVCYG